MSDTKHDSAEAGSPVTLEWADLGSTGRVAVLSINRPAAANAFNDKVIAALTAELQVAATTPGIRALVLRGKGKHFSGGADLAWMRASATLTVDANRLDAERLIDLFEAVVRFPKPTLAVVQGSAFGGAVGLTAACDVAVAEASAKFSLSEVRLGIAPAVIWPYLARRVAPGALTRLALTGRIFGADEAEKVGLVQRVVPSGQLDAAVREELNGFLAGSPDAQAALKRLAARVQSDGNRQGPHTAAAIAELRAGPSGQAGLKAFFAKEAAPWTATVPEDFTLSN